MQKIKPTITLKCKYSTILNYSKIQIRIVYTFTHDVIYLCGELSTKRFVHMWYLFAVIYVTTRSGPL